jgi:small subunit ribosomal protein S8
MVKTKTNTKGKKASTKSVAMARTNYPVGDFLIRVKNAARAGNSKVSAPNTKLVLATAKVLEGQGFIKDVKSEGGILTAQIAKYAKESTLLGLTLISRPGLRHYMGIDALSALKGPEMYIISTSKGVMSSKDALKKSLGGEVIAKVW